MVLPLGAQPQRTHLASVRRIRQHVVRSSRQSNPFGELTHLRRFGSVADYQEKFLQLLAVCDNVIEQQQIDIFTAGLCNPLRIDVELHQPPTLEDKMALARTFKRRLELDDDTLHSSARSAHPPRATPTAPRVPTPPALPNTTTSPTTRTIPELGTRFSRLSPAEMIERCEKGLCFNCPEKFSQDHLKHCFSFMKGIYLLELDEGFTMEDNYHDDTVEISLNALIGIQTSTTMQLVAHVAGAPLCALVDSGSTHSFVVEDAARRAGLAPIPMPGLSIGVTNDDKITSAGICHDIAVYIDREAFCMDLYVLPLDKYDVILGCQWLRTLRPILWDFEQLTLAFWRHEHQVKWFEVATGSTPSLHTTAPIDLLQLLLFADIFEEPQGLPLARRFDHRIHLLPDTAPIAVRPYRYPQLLKDKIDMLQHSLIQPSTSAFFSLVLFVHKHDNSWWFCVDYRALNAKTVKDKFSIPIIDELLDELKGACFFSKLDLHSGYHQVLMHPADIEMTVFCTHHGHFEFLVMLFGSTNAPLTF
ncbi:uncharacterized protein LOC133927558 [Phragmites australis]|uniref:uncharacterized protein LOC133927558 n=1 Tax=Phragmites australis TaxID=29695 RepID=UPI002D76DDFC|nr:uncharacterized protein LOC133927558 [Phragmites australis]